MLKIESPSYDELTDEEKQEVPNNGSGKEYASYIKITHNAEVICLQSDAIEPEDAIFCRDLNWIYGMLQKCYDLGKQDA